VISASAAGCAARQSSAARRETRPLARRSFPLGGADDSARTLAHEEFGAHAAQPSIARIVVEARMPVLLDPERGDRQRALEHGSLRSCDSQMLTVGWLWPSCSAERVTLPVLYSSSNSRSSFRLGKRVS
jgi:hypothetical protein